MHHCHQLLEHQGQTAEMVTETGTEIERGREARLEEGDPLATTVRLLVHLLAHQLAHMVHLVEIGIASGTEMTVETGTEKGQDPETEIVVDIRDIMFSLFKKVCKTRKELIVVHAELIFWFTDFMQYGCYRIEQHLNVGTAVILTTGWYGLGKRETGVDSATTYCTSVQYVVDICEWLRNNY